LPVTPQVHETKPRPWEKLIHCDHFGVWRVSGEFPVVAGADGECRVLVCIEGKGELEHAGANYPSPRRRAAFACRRRSVPLPTERHGHIVGNFASGDFHKAMKKLIVFDLDGTLAESKASIDAEMAKLLDSLLGIVKVSVISGGAWEQFEKQVLAHLSHDERLKNLSLLPTCGTKFYKYDSKWELLYSEDFTDAEKRRSLARCSRQPRHPDLKPENLGRAD
jgi:hypothetical protein